MQETNLETCLVQMFKSLGAKFYERSYDTSRDNYSDSTPGNIAVVDFNPGKSRFREFPTDHLVFTRSSEIYNGQSFEYEVYKLSQVEEPFVAKDIDFQRVTISSFLKDHYTFDLIVNNYKKPALEIGVIMDGNERECDYVRYHSKLPSLVERHGVPLGVSLLVKEILTK